MAAAFDANATTFISGNGVTSLSLTTLTVGSGTNRALVAQMSFKVTTISSLVVNWDSAGTPQACTSIIAANNGANCRSVELGLVNPTAGNKTLAASWTTASDAILNATSWTGVDQTGSTTSFPNGTSATGTTTPASLVITSASGDATMANATTSGNVFTSPTQTATYSEGNLDNISGNGSRAAGAATVTHSWTAPAGSWVIVGSSIKASVATISSDILIIKTAVHRASRW